MPSRRSQPDVCIVHGSMSFISTLLTRRTPSTLPTLRNTVARMSSSATDPSTYIFNHTMFRCAHST